MNHQQEINNMLNNMLPNINQFIEIERKSKKVSLKEKGQDSQSFEPEYHQIKKLGFKINKNKLCIGSWSSQENKIYLQFMIDNLTDFSTQKQRRKTKVFYRLSKILKKRTPDQCRSHHQKLQLKHGDDLYAIMSQINRKVQTSIVQQYADKQHKDYLIKLQKIRKTAEEVQSTNINQKMGQSFYNMEINDNVIRLVISQGFIASW